MWINTETLEVYRTRGDVRKAFKGNVSFPAEMPDNVIASIVWTYGDNQEGRVLPVEVAEQPEFNRRTEVLVELPPEFVDGRWLISWEIAPRDAGQVAADVAAARVRRLRAVDGKAREVLLRQLLDGNPALKALVESKKAAIAVAEDPDSINIDDIA